MLNNQTLSDLIGPQRAIIHHVVECVLIAGTKPMPPDDVPPVLLRHGTEEYWPGGNP